MKSILLKYNLGIAVAAILLFVPFLGAVHLFDWDEINFAECAREMLVTGDYFSVKINFQPFWEKPPVFIWLQALSMNVFGVNEFAARLPDAICGCITLLLIFNIGRKLFDIKFGLVWTLVYAGSLLPHFYFKSGIIDPWFNLFIFCGIYFFILYSNNNAIKDGNNSILKQLLLAAMFIGLAVLTKGPVAVLIFGLCVSVYWILSRFKPIVSIRYGLLFLLALALVGGLWFGLLMVTGNTDIIKEFFLYQIRLFNTKDAGHGGPFFYHFIVLLVGCFPMSVFAFRAFTKNETDTPFQRYFKLWMMILFWVVLILFSIVKTKIVHYSSLCYFPLSFLSAYVVYKIIIGELSWKKSTGIVLITIGSLLGLAVAILPFIDKYKKQIIDWNVIKDSFAVENLKSQVYWSGYEWMLGALLIAGVGVMLYLINKNKIQQGIIGLFVVSLLFVNTTVLIIVPRIEQYSQGAAIEFYEYLKNKECYIETLGFKSYAHLFYSAKKEQGNKNSYELDWLLKGAIDKPVYFVSKINSSEEIQRNYIDLKEVYRKNGFVFYLRPVAP